MSNRDYLSDIRRIMDDEDNLVISNAKSVIERYLKTNHLDYRKVNTDIYQFLIECEEDADFRIYLDDKNRQVRFVKSLLVKVNPVYDYLIFKALNEVNRGQELGSYIYTKSNRLYFQCAYQIQNDFDMKTFSNQFDFVVSKSKDREVYQTLEKSCCGKYSVSERLEIMKEFIPLIDELDNPAT